MDVICFGLFGLEIVLDDLKMSVWDVVCWIFENIVMFFGVFKGFVCVGWLVRYGWVYVEGWSE